MLKQINLNTPEQATTNAGTFDYGKVRIMRITWVEGSLSALLEVGRTVLGEWEMFREFTKRYTTPAQTGTRNYGALVVGTKPLGTLEEDILSDAQTDNEVGPGLINDI